MNKACFSDLISTDNNASKEKERRHVEFARISPYPLDPQLAFLHC
jgi:hypothetical protein